MRKENNLNYWQETTIKLSKDLARRGILASEDQVWKAIQIYCSEKFPDEIEFWTDILHIYIEYEILLTYFLSYDFALNEVEFDTTIANVHYSHILMIKAEVKHKGLIWVVHKTDADPFPSSPHAHDIINKLKMHLGNGLIFKKKEVVGKLPRKELHEVRKKLFAKGIALPLLEV